MSPRRRRPRGGARGAAALLLLGTALLGTGAGLAAGGDAPRITAEELGDVPAGSAPPLRLVPAAAVLPVLAAPPSGPGPATSDAPWLLSAVHPRAAPSQPGSRPASPAPAVAPRPVSPATLELPGRGISAPVEPVGTGRDGGMVVPEQVRHVGWWAPGVLPGGAAGSAVLAGHVDSRTQGVGVLAVLPQLTDGEPVVVRGTDGRAATFRVAARREYGKYDLPREVFRRDGPPQLVLITCGGAFDPAAGSYESNIVVYAVPA
ncbi:MULTISPECIES: class F sortase [Pseudonocardia]|uniref:Sortase family protein n=2 Tax=Pseudonocardia TaxID=1847 RepID=A0A1Y2N4V1_PSEAH|nr:MULTISPECIES: class F sortase [Pseudonocardia]OSY42514.1 Sortase family protein [Pseudonocardia autotrophica]TDN76033.1 sortase family protein [Pseudonocardia autotrophica]BBG00010.1 hypothetical protein Pdca_12190 [Pseudonocardia autotrophica]GEC25069.1 hypothetical protein PSA01_20980 [Pseudonocardia saturnea]